MSHQSNIRVVTRIRPLNEKEIKESDTIAVKHDKNILTISSTGNYSNPQHNNHTSNVRSFEYDDVLGPNVTQEDVYDRAVGKCIQEEVMGGYNVTILVGLCLRQVLVIMVMVIVIVIVVWYKLLRKALNQFSIMNAMLGCAFMFVISVVVVVVIYMFVNFISTLMVFFGIFV